MDTFLGIIDKITENTGRYVSYLLVPVILTVVYSVILRYCFNDIVHWAFEVSLFLYGIFVMVGGAYTLKVKSHVRVDILPGRLSHKWNCYLDLFSLISIIIVCCIIVYLGSKWAWISTLQLERSVRQTPFDPQIWWYKWFIPFSSAILGLQALAETVKTIRSLSNNEEEGVR